MTTLALSAILTGPAIAADTDKWQPYLELHADLGVNRTTSATGEIFVPLWQDQRSLVYGDVAGGLSSRSDGGPAGNTDAPTGDGWIFRGPLRHR